MSGDDTDPQPAHAATDSEETALAMQASTTATMDLADAPDVPRAYAWLVFALIFALLLSDYMSRQVLNAVFPLLKSEWGLTDTQLGSLSGIVALMVGILAFPISLAADRWGRPEPPSRTGWSTWSRATSACSRARRAISCWRSPPNSVTKATKKNRPKDTQNTKNPSRGTLKARHPASAGACSSAIPDGIVYTCQPGRRRRQATDQGRNATIRFAQSSGALCVHKSRILLRVERDLRDAGVP